MENLDEKTTERINKDWEQFRHFSNKLGERTEAVNKMLDYFESRLPFCPASSKKDYHLAETGGLINHSLRVLSNLLKLNKTFNTNFSNESMILVSLFHDLGKVGDLENNFYLPQSSEWHREKLGQYYEINTNMSYMTTSHQTMFLLQYFGVKLTSDEWISIAICDGDEKYNMKECKLALFLGMADRWACEQEKGLNL